MFPIAAEKILSNVVWPAGQALYNEAAPMVKEWARGRIRKRMKGVLSSIDTYSDFSPDSPTKSLFRSPQSTPSRTMSTPSQSQQEQSAGSANKRAREVNGQNSSISPNDGVCVPAMFNAGRGAELGLINKLIDAPLKFKTGENPGPSRPHDPLASSLQLYKPLRFNQAFAWKAHVPLQSFASGNLVNRGYVHNVFRHYNYGTWGSSSGVYSDYAPGTIGWNKTLGPDKAQTRKPPQATTLAEAALVARGFNTTLESPYRNPSWGEVMYSRMTQQFLENMSWAAHPFKYVQPQEGSDGALDTTSPVVYKNAGTAYEQYPRSMPAQQPLSPTTEQSSPYYYRTQMGRGKVAYDFSNDGSGPVVIDVVINKVKQGKTWDSAVVNGLTGNSSMLDDVYKNGYKRMAEANRNLGGINGLSGQEPLPEDCLYNSRIEFMPKAALKYAANITTGQGTGQIDQPFKQIARDQFIISAGATRHWSFELPALDYDARRYSNSNSGAASVDRVIISDICTDFTYIVSIAFSSVSLPLTENPVVPVGPGLIPGTYGAVIDRRPADCNISVTGAYQETCHPVYLSKDTLSTVYINGALDVPLYTTPPTTMRAVEIANLSQVTRDATSSSAYVNVGALNTLSGA